MKRMMLAACIGAASAAATQTSSAADVYDDTGAWYLSPMAQYTLLDHRRDSKDDFGYQVALGYDLPANFAAEVAISTGTFHVRNAGADEKLQSTRARCAVQDSDELVDSAVRAGRRGRYDGLHRNQRRQAQELDGRGGRRTPDRHRQPVRSLRVQFRTEAKYRWEFAQGIPDVPRNPGDVVFGAGVQLMFGAPTPPPPAGGQIRAARGRGAAASPSAAPAPAASPGRQRRRRRARFHRPLPEHAEGRHGRRLWLHHQG